MSSEEVFFTLGFFILGLLFVVFLFQCNKPSNRNKIKNTCPCGKCYNKDGSLTEYAINSINERNKIKSYKSEPYYITFSSTVVESSSDSKSSSKSSSKSNSSSFGGGLSPGQWGAEKWS